MRTMAAALCLLAIPDLASAQDTKANAVTATAVVELPARSVGTLSGDAKVTIKGFGLGAGFPSGQASIEFAVFYHSKETRVTKAGTTALDQVRTENRDLPLVALVRYRPVCPDRLCGEFFGAFGLNFSRQSSVTIGKCGTVQQPAPCTPVNTPLPNRNKEDPTMGAGLGLTVRLSERLDLSPNLGLWYVWRYRDKVEDRAALIALKRTPDNARVELGLTLTWRLR